MHYLPFDVRLNKGILMVTQLTLGFSYLSFGKDFIVGIRTETRNYRELSSIYGHFTRIKPHKQGRIENYQEFCNEYVGVTFGVRCNLIH